MFSIIYLAALVATDVPARAPEPAGELVTVNAPVKEKKICRAETSTGSMMPRSVCRTRSQWAAAAKANDETKDRTQAQGRDASTTGFRQN